MQFTLLHNSFTDIVNTNAVCTELAGDCLFTEGPVWNPAGFYLFSDIPKGIIYRVEETGGKKPWLHLTRPDDPLMNDDQWGSNGLAYTNDGVLLVCQHGGHRVDQLVDGQLRPLIRSYNDRPLNSPNDLVMDKSGTLFFSDPPYGLKNKEHNPEHFQDAARVYAYRNGELKIVNDGYRFPNGVCLSPDHDLLYIGSSKPFENYISIHDTADLRLVNKIEGVQCDGIKTDPAGNVYACTTEGVLVMDPNGERLGLIRFPATPANCCWGGASSNDLLVTARNYVFLVKDLLRIFTGAS